jgi:hypothetical protein
VEAISQREIGIDVHKARREAVRLKQFFCFIAEMTAGACVEHHVDFDTVSLGHAGDDAFTPDQKITFLAYLEILTGLPKHRQTTL